MSLFGKSGGGGASKSLLLLLVFIFFLGCIAQPQEPSIQPELTPGIDTTESPAPTTPLSTEKPTETPVPTPIETIKPGKPTELKLTFPDGTIEENGRFILGEFTENFILKVEPEDAEVYLNSTPLSVTSGSVVLSVNKGGDYEITIKKDGEEKGHNVFIGHGELLAGEWDLYGKFKIFFEDGTLAPNREIIEKTDQESKLKYADENSSVSTICGYYYYETKVRYVDSLTGRLLTTCVTSVDTERG